jgi:5-methyltetrahydrofolate--homocysteine methyltransferase
VETFLRSATQEVVIGPQQRTVFIGERINPTGKKKLAAALTAGDLEVVRQEALSQVAAGADVLDVNVGTAGVNEVDLLPRAVRMVMETVEAPVAIDTADRRALAAALALHKELAPQGKPLINSVNGEEARLKEVLPLVAEYKAAVIGLCMSDEGIPPTPEERLAVAKKIVSRAAEYGIPPQDILIDCLALTVGADSKAGLVALEAMRMVREELGVNMTLGASNASYGLPDREFINNIWLGMVILQGVNAPIVDVTKVKRAILVADLMLGRDDYAMRYLKDYRARQKAASS